MRFVDHGSDFFHRHLVLVDQLDDVDAGIGELANLGARVVRAGDTPTELLRARVGFVLDERSRDVDGRALEHTLVDSVANADRHFERRAEIACARDACQQQLLG